MGQQDESEFRAMWSAIDSGDEIGFGPAVEIEAGRPARLTVQRVVGGYRVRSADRRQDVKVGSHEEVALTILDMVGAGT